MNKDKQDNSAARIILNKFRFTGMKDLLPKTA